MLIRVNCIIGLFLFHLGGQSAFAQNATDTSYQLKEVTVNSNRLTNFSAGTKVIAFDSLSFEQNSNKNLSDLLADESPLFIKSYGLGALGTSSFRGGSANHTAILWNGFNINSPMNGLLDLSLVPVSICDEVSIQYGGTSALWGSGAVGGTIHLNNAAKFNTGLTTKLNLSAGSFSNYNQQLSFQLSLKKVITSIKLYNTTAKNDFQYNNIYSINDNKVTQSNAQLKSYGLLSENYFLINNRQTINLLAWCQHTDRNIPPTMLQPTSKSNQVDKFYRFTSEYKYESRKTTTHIRAAYFNELLIFSDEVYRIDDTSHSQSIITEAEIKINLINQHFVNVGINNTFSNAISSGYPYRPQQNRIAIFASYLFSSKNEKLKATVSGRQELMQNKFVPFTFSVGADYNFTKWLSGKANVAKVYRIPTFNDLYWVPSGNPNLLSESGYSQEIGLNLHLKKNTTAFTTNVTIFNRNIENWIIWLPGISYWTPNNVMSVWSRGMETNTTLSIKINKAKLIFSVLTNYVVSTNQQVKTENDASIDKQLIYVPMYSGMAKASLEFRGFTFSYRHNYTGYRYTSNDNTQFLNPFDLGSLYASYNLQIKNYAVDIFLQANNIWKEEYQVLLNRAMPLQNFNAGISFQFNKPNKL